MTHASKSSPLSGNGKSTHPLFGLFFSQFTGAFNDNAWKLVVFTLATRPLSSSLSSQAFEYGSQMKATFALMVFLIPMMLFSLPAGAIADRFSKRNIIIGMKLLEIVLMAAATAILFISPKELLVPYILLALMGIQSALFSPAKYGILPQVLPYEKLSKGNGLIEMWTMLAIIGGTGLGPVILALDGGGSRPWMTWYAPLFLTLLSLAGAVAAFKVPKVTAARQQGPGMIGTAREAIAAIRGDRILLLAIIGTIFYWSIASLLGQNVLVYAKALVKNLSQGELLQGVPPATYGIGIAIGALMGGRLSGDRIEYGLIPLGAILFAATSLLLGIVQPAMPGTIATLTVMGMATGMLIIPLQAIIQWRAPEEKRGAVIAVSNFLNILGMILGSLLAALMAWGGLDLGRTLIASAFIVVAATIWAVRLLPEALTRLFFVILTTTFYRIRIAGAKNIPEEGAALLISNHLSATDAFFVIASIDRPIRFIMSESHYKKWWLRPFAMAMDAIPVPYSGDAEEIRKAMRQASRFLKRGQLVCIFPEGQVSRTGMMQPFREEVEEIIKGRDCPVIPIHLDRVWGTVFSPSGGRYIPRRPQNIPHPLTVTIGEPLAATTPMREIRESIRELGYQAWMQRKEDEEPIHMHFIRSVWRCPWRTALVDEKKRKISRLKTLTTSIAIARAMREYWYGKETAGIMLHNGFGSVAANLAASIAASTAVNLNYTLGKEELLSAIEDARITSIITSQALLEKHQISLPSNIHVVDIDTLMATLSVRRRFTSSLLGLAAPTYLLEKVCWIEKHRTVDDLLTIVFTGGSTSYPKGVMLSHFNIASNIEGLAQLVPTTARRDKLLHALPIYHPFGYMAMWLSLSHNLPMVLCPDPLDGSSIGQTAKKQRATMLWTTPGYLKHYISQVTPDHFATLKFVLTGMEKLSRQLADDFEQRFGIRPVDGYGAAECSAVIATNTRDVRLPGVFQAGSVRGSVGQPLPGVLVKIIDPVSRDELACNEEGLILVKGPNVMRGYLNSPELTKLAIKAGWYNSGDIGSLDENGNVYIADRQSRIRYIDGEMVSLARLEEALHSAAEISDRQVFAVSTLPGGNAEQGQLIVFHTLPADEIPELIKKAVISGLHPELTPNIEAFVEVEALPIFESGKLNMRALSSMAAELTFS